MLLIINKISIEVLILFEFTSIMLPSYSNIPINIPLLLFDNKIPNGEITSYIFYVIT